MAFLERSFKANEITHHRINATSTVTNQDYYTLFCIRNLTSSIDFALLVKLASSIWSPLSTPSPAMATSALPRLHNLDATGVTRIPDLSITHCLVTTAAQIPIAVPASPTARVLSHPHVSFESQITRSNMASSRAHATTSPNIETRSTSSRRWAGSLRHGCRVKDR